MRSQLRTLVMSLVVALALGITTLGGTVYLTTPDDFTVHDLTSLAVATLLLSIPGAALSAAALSRCRTHGGWQAFALAAGSFVAPPATFALLGRAVGPVSIGEAVLFIAIALVEAVAFGMLVAIVQRRPTAARQAVMLAGLLLLAIATPAIVGSATDRLERGDPANGTVSRIANMTIARANHTATPLMDGRVLIAGGMPSVRGEEIASDTAEVFDPRRNRFTPAGRMTQARAGHTATLLANGDVLLTGGGSASAELFETRTGRFVRVGGMVVMRERHAAVRLTDGSVLVSGGTMAQPSAAAERYDAATRTFTRVPDMTVARNGHTMTLLPDGMVLVAGGSENPRRVLVSAELFDPSRNGFQAIGNMSQRRHKHAAHPLADGAVLIVGGSDERDWEGQLRSVERYAPQSRRFEPLGSLRRARFKVMGSIAPTTSGRFVVAGAGRLAEVYVPRAGASAGPASGSLGAAWFYQTATPLRDGRVLILGGYNASMETGNAAWMYAPPT